MEADQISQKESRFENQLDDEFLSDLTEHRSYNLVLKMVLWGESREDVFQRLSVNNIPIELAERLYQHAWAERIRTIRSDCSHDLLIGLGLIFVSALVFCAFWFGLGFIPRILLFGCFAALGIGLWKFIHGLTGYLMASSKTGSVAD